MIDDVRGRRDRRAVGIVLGGVLAAAGSLLTWLEPGPGPDGVARPVVIDDAGIRILLGLAVLFMVLGGAMVADGRRRRWWPWVLGLAILGFVPVLVSWGLQLAGVDPFSVSSSEAPPAPGGVALGLPTYLLGCVVAGASALRLRTDVPTG